MRNFTRVYFQNCGPQPQYRKSKKATESSLALSAGKYDVLVFVEHDLYGLALDPKHQMHDRMCVMNKGTMTCLIYNTTDEARTK